MKIRTLWLILLWFNLGAGNYGLAFIFSIFWVFCL